MADAKILATIERSDTEQLQISVSEYKGRSYLNMRIFYTTDDGATWLPTKKGVTFAPDQLDMLSEAIEEARKEFMAEAEQKGFDVKYALALVNIKGLGVKTFSYLIPDDMKDIIKIGQAILVPFGRQGLINAFCVGFSDYLPEEIRAKKINKILDETPLFSIEYLKLLEWVANY